MGHRGPTLNRWPWSSHRCQHLGAKLGESIRAVAGWLDQSTDQQTFDLLSEAGQWNVTTAQVLAIANAAKDLYRMFGRRAHEV